MISTTALRVFDQVNIDGRVRSVACKIENGFGTSVILVDGFTGAVTTEDVRRADLDTPRWDVRNEF